MENISKTVLLLVFLIGCVSNAFGQKDNLPTSGNSVEEGKILTKYDAKEDVMLVQLEPFFLYYKEVPTGQVTKDWLRMGAALSYKGKKPNMLDEITLYFASSSKKGCNFPNSVDFEITFVTDSKPIKIGSVYSFNEPASDESCTETVIAKIPRDTFIKISRASKVDLRMAETKVALGKSHLDTLRNFANRMKP